MTESDSYTKKPLFCTKRGLRSTSILFFKLEAVFRGQDTIRGQRICLVTQEIHYEDVCITGLDFGFSEV